MFVLALLHFVSRATVTAQASVLRRSFVRRPLAQVSEMPAWIGVWVFGEQKVVSK